MQAIECKGIKKTYGTAATSVPALRGIDFEMMAGELVMIVGPSGSGKTTLISILAGILDQDEGKCVVYGQDLKELNDIEKTAYRGKHIGFVFQAFNLIPMLTAKENAAIPLLLNGVGRDGALSEAAELLTRFGLQDKLDAYPPELSGGQQQRVAIVRSCIHDPKLIVCDEPTSALDQETGSKILMLLKEKVLEKNRALIVVTHDARIFSFADRIVKLDDGKIVPYF